MFARWLLIVTLAVGLAACQELPNTGGSRETGIAPTAGAGAPANVETTPPGGAVAPVSTPLYGEAPTPGAVILEVKVIHQASDTPAYTIDARYPALAGSDIPYLSDFNQQVETFVFAEIGRFGEEIAANDNGGGFLQIDFMPTQVDANIASILLKVTTYTPGAAHTSTHSVAINYDLQSGRNLSLAKLFRANSAYLETISSACIQDLRQRGTLKWEDGALPREENYRVWNLTPDGLLVTFDEYRVATYDAGAQTVLVPYERLREFIDPNGPLKSLT